MENTFPVSVFALRTLLASETVLTGKTAWPCCLVGFDPFSFAQVSLECSQQVLSNNVATIGTLPSRTDQSGWRLSPSYPVPTKVPGGR